MLSQLDNLRVASFLQYLTVCLHPYCAGSPSDIFHFSTNEPDYPIMPGGIDHDSISEFIVPPGFVLEYFEHGDFQGWYRAIGRRTWHWTHRLEGAYGGQNDQVSSFRLRRIPAGGVWLCQHHECGDQRIYYEMGWSAHAMPSEVPNDTLSRIYISAGWKVTIFEHDYWGGASTTFGSRSEAQNILLGYQWWNDKASSFVNSVW
jgi:hypothetical protein